MEVIPICHGPFIWCNQINYNFKTNKEEAIYRFLTFDLITGDLYKIGHDSKRMVKGHDLRNPHTKFENISCMYSAKIYVQNVDLVMPVKVGQ